MERDNILVALESLNRQCIDYKNSKEYKMGKKIIRLLSELRTGQFTLQLKRYRKRQLLKKVEEIEVVENCSLLEWEANIRRGLTGKKIIVYSCITGGYDLPKRPLYYPDNVDYVMFLTDVNEYINDCGWICKEIPNEIAALGNDVLINRYIKLHPFELFSTNYEIAIYVDGNITPVSDLSIFAEWIDPEIGVAMHKHCSRNCIYEEVKSCQALKKGNAEKLSQQAKKYKCEGFPVQYGMLECNVIVCELDNPFANKIFQAWWNEVLHSESGRDQIALPYILWRADIEVEKVSKLGNNVYRNVKLQISEHRTKLGNC